MPAPNRPLRISSLLLLGLVVAFLHIAGLSWLREQLPSFEPLAKMAEPLFTRSLEPAAVLPPVPGAATPLPGQPPQGPLRLASALDATAMAPAAAASEPAPSETAQAVQKIDDAIQPTPEGVAAQRPDPPALAEPAQAPAASGQADAAPPANPGLAVDEARATNPSVTPAPADSWPASTRLSYTVTGHYRGDLHGSARVQWQRDGAAGGAAARYQVQLELYALGITLFTMTSQGELGTQGLAPRVYEERRPGGVRRVWFEGDALRLDDGRKLPLPELAQDTASQFVELGHRFSTGREVLQVGREVAIWLARPGGVDLWTYDVVAEENLQTNGFGRIAAFRLKPRPLAKPRGNVTAEIWFAPSLQFLPVRVRITMGQEYGNETFVDLLVERIEQAAK